MYEYGKRNMRVVKSKYEGGGNSSGNGGGGRHVRCYCNLPACVTTGYLCKSPLGGCFSELPPDLHRARYGCIDGDPDKDQKANCMNNPSSKVNSSAITTHSTTTAGSLVLCCFKDLCNHVDSPQLRLRINDTIAATGNWSNHGSTHNTLQSGSETSGGGDNGDLWFKAATIIVPIFGALILFVLIALAVKLLRSDAMDSSNKLSASYVPQSNGQSSLEQPLMKKPLGQRISGPQTSGSVAPLLVHHSNVTERVNFGLMVDSHPKSNPPDGAAHSHSSPLFQKSKTKDGRDVNLEIPADRTKDVNCQKLILNEKLYTKDTIYQWGQGASNLTHSSK